MSSMDVETRKALDRALRALGHRAHSEQEIVDKLTRAGFDEHTIAQAMAALSQHRLTDDNAFADQWACARARRGMGPWRIAQELRHKGVSTEAIDKALEGFDEENALERATGLAKKHLQRGDPRARKRAYDALVRRGFDFDMAHAALRAASESLDMENDEESSFDD